MNNRNKETLSVRIISVGFTCLALAVFKPLGIGEMGMMLYVHLLAIWVLGLGICYVTEALMKHIVKMPATLSKGADYVIRRNLWFQLINTPLEALLISIYLHFPMTRIGAADPLSLKGFLQVMLVIAFCSFAIGLYWRYKFRSRYLTTELEETKARSEQIQSTQVHSAPSLTLTGNTSEKVSLNIDDLLFIETVGNYVKVYHLHDNQLRTDMLRATSRQMEDELHAYPSIVRCHRAYLVNLSQVEQLTSNSGNAQLIVRHCHEAIPVSRSNVSQIRKAIGK